MVRRWRKGKEGERRRAETYERTLQQIQRMGTESPLRRGWERTDTEERDEVKSWIERWNTAEKDQEGRSATKGSRTAPKLTKRKEFPDWLVDRNFTPGVKTSALRWNLHWFAVRGSATTQQLTIISLLRRGRLRREERKRLLETIKRVSGNRGEATHGP